MAAEQKTDKPVVLITGAAGAIGTALVEALGDDYTVVGLDLEGMEAACECHAVDLTSEDSVELALRKVRDAHGGRFASVVHLAAYFDFSGEDHPLYDKLNVGGTRNLLRKLQDFEVGQFVYSGTMLVHEPCEPGQHIDEDTPLAPAWVYPKSKAAAEEVIREEHGDIPYVLLHLAGLYADDMAVPTLSEQIARIYERDIKSHLYAGDLNAGQALVHKDDMVDAFRRAIDRRGDLPADVTILIGEPDPPGYEELQDRIGCLIHGEAEWETIKLPSPLAKAGAWLETEAEPVIPDAIDKGEEPFIKPFMIDMASDHYALDITRARELLGWEPRHDIREELPKLIRSLEDDPAGWYERNGVTPPDWVVTAAARGEDPDALHERWEENYRTAHRRNLWGHFLNIGLGSWLITSPPLLGYDKALMGWSDVVSGVLVITLALMSLSWRATWARWATAAVGCWIMFAPLVVFAEVGAAYLNGTLVGALVIGFAVATRPDPGVAPVAAMTGPTIPPGWDFNPSTWFQRMPIIILAFVGLYVSRYLAAYQLGYVDGVWDPFFTGGPGPKNGTEEITTSAVSEAWPVPDAGLGAMTYMLEILVGIVGSERRWRTMPWLVMLFGIMIVPLGVVSITFIVIQPIVLGTWCTLCLLAAAAMLLQIPYSLDELVATTAFLIRRKKKGRPLLLVFFRGDTDDGAWEDRRTDFNQSPLAMIKDMIGGGVTVPWNLGLCLVIGVWLMFTRNTTGAEGLMADSDHLMGSLVLTVTVTAFAETVRPIRFLNMLFGLCLIVAPFVFDAGWAGMANGVVCGLLLIALSVRRGPVRAKYGGWQKAIV